ncbi:hypothetical protein C6361_31975 [Plantactinospora sp. BC1]|nr:hypothetical protein C6361_31975 [Plantactinospora sp. BC1]
MLRRQQERSGPVLVYRGAGWTFRDLAQPLRQVGAVLEQGISHPGQMAARHRPGWPEAAGGSIRGVSPIYRVQLQDQGLSRRLPCRAGSGGKQ